MLFLFLGRSLIGGGFRGRFLLGMIGGVILWIVGVGGGYNWVVILLGWFQFRESHRWILRWVVGVMFDGVALRGWWDCRRIQLG